jgi:hypothetical protein
MKAGFAPVLAQAFPMQAMTRYLGLRLYHSVLIYRYSPQYQLFSMMSPCLQ